jgi:hypothetical protein
VNWTVEYSEGTAGPFELLLELSADSWEAAEHAIFHRTEGLVPLGYYRVRGGTETAGKLYVWDGQRGSFRLLESTTN